MRAADSIARVGGSCVLRIVVDGVIMPRVLIVLGVALLAVGLPL
ncbi:hypothetical protein [Aromatoleum diolicum]|nr:hypothetical protein [Aromatoleum diolicum]